MRVGFLFRDLALGRGLRRGGWIAARGGDLILHRVPASRLAAERWGSRARCGRSPTGQTFAVPPAQPVQRGTMRLAPVEGVPHTQQDSMASRKDKTSPTSSTKTSAHNRPAALE